MQKRILFLAFCLVLLLPACASSSSDVSLGSQVASPTRTSATLGQGERKPGCTVVSRQPTPNPTEQAIISPPGESDWVKGPEQASVTIIEYGDFQ